LRFHRALSLRDRDERTRGLPETDSRKRSRNAETISGMKGGREARAVASRAAASLPSESLTKRAGVRYRYARRLLLYQKRAIWHTARSMNSLH